MFTRIESKETIIDEVKTRVIAEKIKLLHEEYGNINRDFSAKASSVLILGIVMTILFISLLCITGNIFYYALSAFSIVPAWGLTMIISDNKEFDIKDKETKINKEIMSLRKELVEQSLNMEIIKGGDKINATWQEIHVSKTNNKVVKRYVKIVNDSRTGFETVKSKVFKNREMS